MIRTTHTTTRLSSNLRCHFCLTFCDDGLQRAAHGWRCEATEGATAADALGVMSSCRSVWPWLQRRTTARSPGQRRGGGARRTTRHGDRSLHPRGRGQPAWLSREGDVMQVQRHTVEHLADGAPCLPTLDVPVPQIVDQPVDILKIIAKLSPAVEEQVIDVPKIIQDPAPQRLEPSEPQQLAEQLVDVPVPSVREVTIFAPFVDTAGRTWTLITRPDGRYVCCLAVTQHVQWTRPGGDHPPAQGGKDEDFLRPLVPGSHLFGVGLPEEYLCGFSSGRRLLDYFRVHTAWSDR